MSLIPEVAREDATGTVLDIYSQCESMFEGWIPAALKAHSINPAMMKNLWEYIGYYMQHPSLSPTLFTAIRMLVSVDKQCTYCVDMNAGMLIDAGIPQDTVMAMRADPSVAPFDAKEKALLLFTLEATRNPLADHAGAMQALRDLGSSDLEIYDCLNHGARQVMGDILLNVLQVEKDF